MILFNALVLALFYLLFTHRAQIFVMISMVINTLPDVKSQYFHPSDAKSLLRCPSMKWDSYVRYVHAYNQKHK